MFWADKVAKEIIDAKKYNPIVVDDMFTPSGFAHIGSIRGPLVHDLVFKALKDVKSEVRFTYVINDFDPIDGLPDFLKEEFTDYLGYPLRSVPSPEGKFDSFGEYFADDIKTVLKSLGVEAEYYSSWDMYHEGKFDEAIRLALDNAELIQDIYHEVSGSQKKAKGWLPLQVICENCGKLGTTRVHDWNGETVEYTCEPNMVTWAQGCKYTGRISPFGGNGKLPWKVDWPAHWSVIKVTVEGAGKDHSVAGGSRDIARELCQKIFKIQEPYNLPYEFLTIGGKKMASSKGLGLKAHDLSDLLPKEVARFLYCRTDYRREVSFDPNGTMAIPDLYDEYDRCFKAYIENSNEELARAFELSQIDTVPPKQEIFLPRFRDIVNYVQQPSVDLLKRLEEVKGSSLTEFEIQIIEERKKYAHIWISKYAPEEFKMQMNDQLPENIQNLNNEQKQYLAKVSELVIAIDDAEELQLALYNLSKEMNMEAKKAFAAIYTALIGKEYGPKAGSFLLSYPKEDVIKRLKEVSEYE